MPAEETLLFSDRTGNLGTLRFRHPPGTFALTPASLISLEAIFRFPQLLQGDGLDWGSGTGCLAIAAARIPAVRSILGLEIVPANVAIAGENARVNGVADKVAFLLSDSYIPLAAEDRARLEPRRGQTDFILANPHASDGDDGFGCRRAVLRGARDYLKKGGVVFLMVSYQYGEPRIRRLCQEALGFAYCGKLVSSDWVPFDLGRADLLHNARTFAAEERRGGLAYTFRHPIRQSENMSAQAALAHFEATGQSPLSKWQVHRFTFESPPWIDRT